ncbi:hypothetical protein WME77_19200 [Sorangium sp. So ce764]|uniref:hypothetical protein n=1 Tax=Sorangium sp. So ce764 TaxID=3133320 RepID=UPI003F6255E1
MKFETCLVDVGGDEQLLAGRARGDRLYQDAIIPALSDLTPERLLLLSFRGVEFVTGSIFKATWHRLHPDDGVAVPSLVVHLSDDVRNEFAMYLRGHRMAGLEALDWSGTEIMLATLHGHVEDSSFAALQALSANPGSTAPQLHSACGDNVSATAWTNRLNELHKQGLAFREKAGRAWRFYPIAREVRRG